MIDKLFDIQNSRSPYGRFSKSPIKEGNWAETLQTLNNISSDLTQLKRQDGKLLIESNRYASKQSKPCDIIVRTNL